MCLRLAPAGYLWCIWSQETFSKLDSEVVLMANTLEILPNEILHHVLQYLPLNTKVRVGRVCRLLRQLSQDSVTETEWLDFQERIFDRLGKDSLTVLLSLCSANIKVVILRSLGSLVTAFSQFSCPKLTKIILKSYGQRESEAVDSDCLKAIIRNNPNLRTVVWCTKKKVIEFPQDITAETLVVLKLDKCSECTFRSLIGQCPRLKHFQAVIDVDVTNDSIDQFFARSVFLETIILTIKSVHLNLEKLEHFWTLPLKVLAILDSEVAIDERALTKIAQFPLLENLDLRCLDVRSDCVAKLAASENLHHLTLYGNGYNNIDGGLHQIVQGGRLHTAQMDGEISLITLSALISQCPHLRYLWVNRVSERVKDLPILPDCDRLINRSLLLRIGFPDGFFTSRMAKIVLGNLDAEEGSIRPFGDVVGDVRAIFE